MMQKVVERPVDATAEAVDMTAKLGGAVLPNPVLTASGCAAFGRELAEFFPVSQLGALVTPSLTREPRAGLPSPRMVETASGMLNCVGMQGPGIEMFCTEHLPWLDRVGARVVVSIAGRSAEEFADVAAQLRGAAAVVLIEANISSPTLADRGQLVASDPEAAAQVIAAVRAAADPAIPVFAKLSPDVTDIVPMAVACVRAGADGLTLVNTPAGMAIDTDTMRPALSGITGGLSGPAIRPVAVRCVWQVHAALPAVPILGVGGIASGLDALQFILAGAQAVSVGTAVFHDPCAPVRVLDELRDALFARGFATLADAVGYAHRAKDAT